MEKKVSHESVKEILLQIQSFLFDSFEYAFSLLTS